MNENASGKQEFNVRIGELEGADGALVFSFVPKTHPNGNGMGGIPVRNPQFMVLVRGDPSATAFDWSRSPDDPGMARDKIEADVRARMLDRAAWLDRVNALVDRVEQWARELGWATRRIEKKLEDDWVGNHRVPALLMQEDTCRILLEPVGRSSIEVQGIVDLYVMPAFDDIARLFYSSDRWNLHPAFSEENSCGIDRDVKATPLSKETLATVLADMRQHAV